MNFWVFFKNEFYFIFIFYHRKGLNVLACFKSLRQNGVLHTARAVLKLFPSQFVPSHSSRVFSYPRVCVRTQQDTENRKPESSKFMWRQRGKQYNSTHSWEPTVGRGVPMRETSWQGGVWSLAQQSSRWVAAVATASDSQWTWLVSTGTAFCLASDTQVPFRNFHHQSWGLLKA